VIAASLPIILSIWLLSAGIVIVSLHMRWMFKRHLELQERVHRLEMEQLFPGWAARQAMEDALDWRDAHPPESPGSPPPRPEP
jgi:hypothetical protein